MKYSQSRMATKIEFNFEEDELEYSMQDNTADLKFEVRYGNFPKRSQRFYERNEWLRNVGLIWVFLGLGITAWNFTQGVGLSLSFWFYVGALCLVVYRATWSEYIYYDTEDGRILVLNNKDADKIIQEITARRKAAYMEWFEGLEFNGDFDAAQKALNYMVKENAMTKNEADQRLAHLEADGRPRLVSSNDDTPPQIH